MIFVPLVKNGLPLTQYPIATVNWPSFSARLEASVRIGWDATAIHLCFEVHDTAVQALVTDDNGPVWRDRCVEWFVSFDGENYYNIEANAIGTLLVQYGPDRTHRVFIAPERIMTVRRTPSLGRFPFRLTKKPLLWSLSLEIPLSFFHPEGNQIKQGICARGNFYLCGDDLPVRQYLSHYPVASKEPDFHRPESFGPLLFT